MTVRDAAEDAERHVRSLRAVLDAVGVAAVVVDAQGRPVWANRVATALAEGDGNLETSRLFGTLAACGPAVEARAEGVEARGRVRVPTALGLVDRSVTAVPLPAGGDGDGANVVVSFAPPDPTSASEDVELRARLDAMLEHTTDIITVLDRDGSILFSNAAAGRLTGLSGAEVNGRLALELIHPDDMDQAASALTAALDTPGPGEKIELRVRFADDEWHVVEVSVNNLLGVPPIDGLVVTLHDVTERKAMETRLESLIANLTDVIVVLDDQFDITFASESISRLIDAPPATNLGMNAFNDIHPDDVGAAIDALTAVRDGGLGATTQVDVRIESSPGSQRWRRLVATAVNRLTDSAIRGIIVTLRDVTEERRAADELQAAYERERATADRLRELDQLKDDFLATVSHELRTPLAAIVGFTDLIAAGSVDAETQARLVGRISASASDMRAMIDNVLDFSALEAGRIGLELAPLDVRDVLDRALATVAHQLRGHEVLDDVPRGTTVVADHHGVGHIVRNLLTNAARYSEAGSAIVVRATVDGDWVRLEVADQGIGIAVDEQDRIFERFYRAPSASFVARGSGIGLNIAKRYAELMGGRIGVTSVPGQGSTFIVMLPAA